MKGMYSENKIKGDISGAVRDALDEVGIEITWADSDAAAAAVYEVIEDLVQQAWQYNTLTKGTSL